MADGYQIVTRVMIQQRARFAFLRGQTRESHNMNPSAALDTWLAEYDYCTANEVKCTRPSWVGVDLAQEACV